MCYLPGWPKSWSAETDSVMSETVETLSSCYLEAKRYAIVYWKKVLRKFFNKNSLVTSWNNAPHAFFRSTDTIQLYHTYFHDSGSVHLIQRNNSYNTCIKWYAEYFISSSRKLPPGAQTGNQVLGISTTWRLITEPCSWYLINIKCDNFI